MLPLSISCLNASPIRPRRGPDMPSNSGAPTGNPCAHTIALEHTMKTAAVVAAIRFSITLSPFRRLLPILRGAECSVFDLKLESAVQVAIGLNLRSVTASGPSASAYADRFRALVLKL